MIISVISEILKAKAAGLIPKFFEQLIPKSHQPGKVLGQDGSGKPTWMTYPLHWEEAVEDILDDPPANPSDGERYIVGTTPTGAWSGHANDIAEYNASDSEWVFYTPYYGLSVQVKNKNTYYTWNNTAWVEQSTFYDHATLQNLNWSQSGHTIDADLDMNGHNVKNVEKVGIGTSSPEARLHIKGGAPAETGMGVLVIDRNNTDEEGHIKWKTGNNLEWLLGTDNGGAMFQLFNHAYGRQAAIVSINPQYFSLYGTQADVLFLNRADTQGSSFLTFRSLNTNGQLQPFASIGMYPTNPTAGSETGSIRFYIMDSGIWTYRVFLRANGHFVPKDDNTGAIGESSKRWSEIHAVNVYSGDIILENGWRISEYENGTTINGVRILSKDGTEIFKITEDGVFFKGKKIAG